MVDANSPKAPLSMELNIRQTELLKELQLLQGIVERKNTIPILANVLIEAEDGASEVRLAATDLEVGLRSRCAATVVKGGSVTLPARKLYEIVRALPDAEIRISEPTTGTVNVTAERFNSRIQTLPREDFPSMPDAGGATTAHLASAPLAEMIAKTQFAITGEDTRFFLNGALFLLSSSSMSLVATDGHRLALASAASQRAENGAEGGAGGDEEEQSRVILPRKTLSELARLLGEDSADEVAYEQGENHLFFDLGTRQLISRTIDAQFPAHERVLPKGNDKRVEFDRDRLVGTLKRVALLSNERSRAVKFQIDAGGVEISSSSPDVGEASEVLAVDYEGPQTEICFNAQYVLDFLGVVDSDSVVIDFKNEVSQAVLSPMSTEGCEYTYVIMPMRV